MWCDDLGALDNPRVDLRAVKIDQGRLVRKLHLPCTVREFTAPKSTRL